MNLSAQHATGWFSITICNCRSGGSPDWRLQRGAAPKLNYCRWRSGKLARSRAKPGPCQLLKVMPNGQTRMEWLRTGPASRKPKGLASQIEKIAFLKELGSESLNLGISALSRSEERRGGKACDHQ